MYVKLYDQLIVILFAFQAMFYVSNTDNPWQNHCKEKHHNRRSWSGSGLPSQRSGLWENCRTTFGIWPQNVCASLKWMVRDVPLEDNKLLALSVANEHRLTLRWRTMPLSFWICLMNDNTKNNVNNTQIGSSCTFTWSFFMLWLNI